MPWRSIAAQHRQPRSAQREELELQAAIQLSLGDTCVAPSVSEALPSRREAEDEEQEA